MNTSLRFSNCLVMLGIKIYFETCLCRKVLTANGVEENNPYTLRWSSYNIISKPKYNIDYNMCTFFFAIVNFNLLHYYFSLHVLSLQHTYSLFCRSTSCFSQTWQNIECRQHQRRRWRVFWMLRQGETQSVQDRMEI